MIKTTSSTKKSNKKENKPKESTVRMILEFAATYRLKHTDLFDIEYSLN